MKIAIINGPNLNLLGEREPHLYGNIRFDNYLKTLEATFTQVSIEAVQSNLEGELVGWIQEFGKSKDGIILNPGGYAHTSVAILDAIQAIQVPVVEVHVSNVHARESYRHNLLTAAACVGVISGLGLASYYLAIEYLSGRSA